MISPAACLLYSQDHDLVRRFRAFLRGRAFLRHVEKPDRLAAVLQQNSPALLLIDLRARESRDLLPQVQAEWPQVVIIALGIPRSEPLRDAEQAEVYAAEDLALDRRRLQALIGRALEHLRLLEENYCLREETIPARATPALVAQGEPGTKPGATVGPPLPVLRFARAFHRSENLEMLMHSVVEGVADAAMVSRVGLFARVRQSERYRLRAGLRCLPETSELFVQPAGM